MNTVLKESITGYLSGKVAAVGFATIDRFDDAPENHHPEKVCKDARTVIVFGSAVPASRIALHMPLTIQVNFTR